MKVNIKMGNLKDMGDIFGHVDSIILDYGKMAKEMDKAHNSKKMEQLRSKGYGKTIN